MAVPDVSTVQVSVMTDCPGFSPIEVLAMGTIVFAGASQFAAVGYVASGLAWPLIMLLTFLLNARHLLYSAALAPWLLRRAGVPAGHRADVDHVGNVTRTIFGSLQKVR